jgi:protein TonB
MDVFLITSILFHVLLLFLFSLITMDSIKDEDTPLVVEFEDEQDKDNYEFNDFPQINETDEEVDTHRLSDKNRKVEEETVARGSSLGGGPTRPERSSPFSPGYEPERIQPPEELLLEEEKLKKEESEKSITDEREKSTPTRERERLTTRDLMPSRDDVARLDQPLGTASEGIREGETVSLNTQEFKYYAYFSHIKKQIEMAWNYPMEAQEKNWGGRLSVVFIVEEDGWVSSVKLINSSGYEILDDAAIRAINFASPFNPIPETIGVERLKISASFEYITALFGVKW